MISVIIRTDRYFIVINEVMNNSKRKFFARLFFIFNKFTGLTSISTTPYDFGHLTTDRSNCDGGLTDCL